MRKKYIDQLNDRRLYINLNIDAYSIEEPDGYPQLQYNFENGKMFSWDWNELLNLEDLDDSQWDEAIADPENGSATWFDCFVETMICAVMDSELSGSAEFNDFVREGKTKLCAFLNGDDVEQETNNIDLSSFL